MAKKSKKSRLTVRLNPKVHARIAEVARAWDITVNSVMGLMIARCLRRMELEVYIQQALVDQKAFVAEMREWRAKEAGRTRKQFVRMYINQIMQEESIKRGPLPDVSGPATGTIDSLPEPVRGVVPKEFQLRDPSNSAPDEDK